MTGGIGLDYNGTIGHGRMHHLLAETRTTVLIDPDGIVRAIEQHDDSIGRDPRELVRKLEAATFVRANSLIVCPAAWAPSHAMLTPSPALVGQL